ncbi:MAG: DUF501 domain-containing protein [Synergistaceae bacterium]|nr:DUF501 domain-containing protein [Synergistaceae bacterium]
MNEASNEISRPEEATPPAFWTPLREGEREILLKQNRGRVFDCAEVLFVARRCGGGYPQAVVSNPLSPEGLPFPTLFWLTCPYLRRRCGELESAHKIAELETIFAADGEAVKKWHAAYAALRLSLIPPRGRERIKKMKPGIARVLSESGVGGINLKENPHAAKCLHLQTATLLGLGSHPAESWLRAELGAMECAGSLV